MTYTLTLIASDIPLSSSQIKITELYLQSENIKTEGTAQWIEEHKVAKLSINQSVTIDQMKALRQIHDENRIDVFCTSSTHQQKKLFLADMDSTIVTTETLDELAEEAGIKNQIAEITERAMRGELDFHTALKERVQLIKDLPISALERTLHQTKISEGAETLLKGLRAQNIYCVLVSGGFTYFTKTISENQAPHG